MVFKNCFDGDRVYFWFVWGVKWLWIDKYQLLLLNKCSNHIIVRDFQWKIINFYRTFWKKNVLWFYSEPVLSAPGIWLMAMSLNPWAVCMPSAIPGGAIPGSMDGTGGIGGIGGIWGICADVDLNTKSTITNANKLNTLKFISNISRIVSFTSFENVK